MRLFFIISLLLIPIVSFGDDVFSTTGSEGEVIYTDVPTESSKKMETLTSPQTVSPQQTESKSVSEIIEARKPYTTFTIVSPTDQQTFQNERAIPVQIKIDPDLQKGDKIKLIVDGKAVGEGGTGPLVLPQLDRGSHQLSAQLLDEKNNVMKQSNTVTIYVHYARLGTEKNRITPP